jgi:PAT family acetyl-CoA transporter-like MFS transporter 1
MRFWAFVFAAVTFCLAMYKTEDPVSEDDPDMDVKKVYKVMWSIVQLKSKPLGGCRRSRQTSSPSS